VTFHAQTIATFSSNFTDEAADMRERGECPYDTEGSNTLIRICWMNSLTPCRSVENRPILTLYFVIAVWSGKQAESAA
jgi:hypothetical protein